MNTLPFALLILLVLIVAFIAAMQVVKLQRTVNTAPLKKRTAQAHDALDLTSSLEASQSLSARLKQGSPTRPPMDAQPEPEPAGLRAYLEGKARSISSRLVIVNDSPETLSDIKVLIDGLTFNDFAEKHDLVRAAFDENIPRTLPPHSEPVRLRILWPASLSELKVTLAWKDERGIPGSYSSTLRG